MHDHYTEYYRLKTIFHWLMFHSPQYWPSSMERIQHQVHVKVSWKVKLNSIYQTPRDFIKILYWSCNHQKTGFTEGPAERAAGKNPEQLQSSSSASDFTFRVPVGSKCGEGKSALTENNQRVNEHCSRFHRVLSPLHLSHCLIMSISKAPLCTNLH